MTFLVRLGPTKIYMIRLYRRIKEKRALLEEAIYRSFGDSRAGVLRYYYFDSEAVIHSDDMEFEEITDSYDWDKGEPWEWF